MTFQAKHVTRTHTIALAAAPQRAFPLFEPLGEQAWSDEWRPAFVHPASGEAIAGAVFTVSHPNQPETIWTLIAHDPAALHLAYVRTTPWSLLAIIDVTCAAAPDGSTLATITYAFTALGEAGNMIIAEFTEEHYRDYIAKWEHSINHYLLTGQSLPHH